MLPIITIKRRLDGRNGLNGPGFVVIDPDAPYPAAVWAQEAWESQHRLTNPVNWIATMWPFRKIDPSPTRRMEIMGHEVEVQAAVLIYGVDANWYRDSEARAMRRGYGGLFSSTPLDDLIEAMKARSDDARQWVRRHRSQIESNKEA